MRKNFLFTAIIFLALSVLYFSSCKDEYVDPIQLQSSLNDSLLKVGGVIRYSVNIVPVGGTAFLKSTASGDKKVSAAGAVVTVSQNGNLVSDTANEGGIVVFDDMRIGNVSVNVSLVGHSTVKYTADLTPAGGLSESDGISGGGGSAGIDLSRVVRTAATLVPMFPVTGDNMATVEGIATIQSNLTNSETEIPIDAKITAQLDITDPGFTSFWQTLGYNYNYEGAGRIIKMAFTDAVYSATVGADGKYSLSVPAAGQPGVPVKLEVSDYRANQILLMNTMNGQNVFGSQEISTLWGENITPSPIPNVAGAYVTVSDPVGAEAMVTTLATGVASIDNSNGISSINITSPGNGYADPSGIDYYFCTINQGGQFNQGMAIAYVSLGKITHVVVTSPGYGYSQNAVLDIKKEKSAFIGNIQVDGNGAIINYSILSPGEYRSKPSGVQIFSINGSGANLTPNWYWNGNSWSVNSFNINNPGSGYLANSTLLLDLSGGVEATYNINLTTGTLTSIAVTNSGDGYYSAPKILISGGGGTGASATAHLDNNTHRVDYITVDNPGSGFTSAPEVQILLENFVSQAKINLSINNMGVITNASIADAGMGYFTVPTLTIVPSIMGMGSGAQLIAVINVGGGQIVGVNLIKGGSNYLGANYPANSPVYPNFQSSVMIHAISGMNYVRNLDFGTGERSILY
jgi:hypothetical protein